MPARSIDFVAIPGFGGTPPNLLVALAPDGRFLDARILSHHEPVFLEGMGEEPLIGFVQQYVGMSAKRAIGVGRANARANGAPAISVVDGISMATASTRVVNETMLASALAVARAKLGFGAGRSAGLKVEARQGFEPLDWGALVARGFVERVTATNREVDAAFADTSTADADPVSAERPDEPFIDTYVAYLNVASIGRNLLGDKGFDKFMAEMGPDAHALMLLTTGRWNALGEDFVLGSLPKDVAVVQDGLTVAPGGDAPPDVTENFFGFAATSAGAGTPFSKDAADNHLFDPRTGRSPHLVSQVAAFALGGMLADGLSTAAYVMGEERGRALAERYGARIAANAGPTGDREG